MAEIPEQIVLNRHRDLEGRQGGVRWRRSVLVLLTLFLVAGLLDVFGQQPSDTTVQGAAASVELSAPAHLRGGLLYAAIITIRARRTLQHATLVFSPAWTTAQQMNTIEPSPVSQASDNGELSFLLGKIRAGSTYKLALEFQVDPTSVGRRAGDIWLYDGNRQLVQIDRTMTFFP